MPAGTRIPHRPHYLSVTGADPLAELLAVMVELVPDPEEVGRRDGEPEPLLPGCAPARVLLDESCVHGRFPGEGLIFESGEGLKDPGKVDAPSGTGQIYTLLRVQGLLEEVRGEIPGYSLPLLNPFGQLADGRLGCLRTERPDGNLPDLCHTLYPIYSTSIKKHRDE